MSAIDQPTKASIRELARSEIESPIRRILVGIAVVFGAASILGVTGQTSAESRSILHHADSAGVAEVVNNYHNALSTGDSSAALALLADDAVILESGGMESRSEYRSHHLAGDISFARAVKSAPAAAIQVTIAGSSAWTASTSTTQGTFNGRTINSLGAESMVLTKSTDGWRIRSIHWSSRNRSPAR